MKKRRFPIIALILSTICGVVLMFPKLRPTSPVCAEAGKYVRTMFSPIPRTRECCSGLDELNTGIDTDPVCSDCGNGVCENWENNRNCSEDCK